MAKTVTKEQVQEIMDNSEYEVFHRVFGKQCIVVAKLPNGFTVVGESACVDPNNYDETIGANIAKSRIENKIWELEGYKLQNSIIPQGRVFKNTAGFHFSEHQATGCITHEHENGELCVLPIHFLKIGSPVSEYTPYTVLSLNPEQQLLDWLLVENENCKIDAIGYDPVKDYHFVERLKSHKFKTQEVRQGEITLSPVVKDIERIIGDSNLLVYTGEVFEPTRVVTNKKYTPCLLNSHAVRLKQS